MADQGGVWAKKGKGTAAGVEFMPKDAVAAISDGPRFAAWQQDNPGGTVQDFLRSGEASGKTLAGYKQAARKGPATRARTDKGATPTRQTPPKPGMSVPGNNLSAALQHVENGGSLYVRTALRHTVINSKTLSKFRAAGQWLLREEGEGYRLQMGKTSVYLLPGQLKFGE